MQPGQPQFAEVTLADQLVVFAISLLLGGLAIYLAARYVLGTADYLNAVLTAFIGAVVWAVLSWIPIGGTLLALIAWIAVIKWRFPAGWVQSVIIGVAAWAVAIVVLAALAILGVGSFGAIGVPGT